MIEELPLHPSDPTHYYKDAINSSFYSILKESKTNTFYPIINWGLAKVWEDPYWFCVWIKIDNCLLAILIYLLMTYKMAKITILDYILLFNPYMILTLNRNVRDLYIILFVLIIFIGFKAIQDNTLPKYIIFIAFVLLAMTRAVLLGIFVIIWLVNRWSKFNKSLRVICVFVISIISFYGLEIMIRESMNQMISAMDFAGQSYDDILPLMTGNYSVSAIIAFLKRFMVAFSVFLLTPNPLNFLHEWLSNMTNTGASNIYTGFDNLLILIGSIYYYVFIVPYIIICIFQFKKFNRQFALFSLMFTILYSISYLGQTDIRNHNTFIYFFIASIMFAKEPIKLKLRDYYASILLCFGIGKKSII